MATAAMTQPEQQTATPAGKRRQYYPGLDGLRGVAILAVFLSHYSGGHTHGNAAAHLVASVLDAGWMGVDLFFVLSGFLITGILLDTADEPRRVRNFYARRALRIFPVYYGVLCAFLLLTPVLHLHWLPQHALYFLYLSNMYTLLVQHVIPPGLGVDFVHFWSLAVEEQFYLLWPVLVWKVRDKQILFRIALGIMLLAFLSRVVMVANGVSPAVIYQLLPARADSLICGGALALIRHLQPHRRLRLMPILIGSGVAIVAMFVVAGSTLHDSAVVSTVGYSVIALFCGCVVYYAQQETGWVRRLTDRNVLRFFGRYSYGLYIYHGVLLVFLFPHLPYLQRQLHSEMLGGALFVLLALGISLGVAMISFHFIETPILRHKRYFA